MMITTVIAVITIALGMLMPMTLPIRSDAGQTRVAPTHKNVNTTVFWVGERGGTDNGNISNLASAWDEQWQARYGGVDDPEARRGYYPAAFTPRENPFYVALPYDDLNDAGQRKFTAGLCPNAKNPKLSNYSWCKNAWLRIINGNRTAYAQWEDVGPYQEDDVAYVFGTNRPLNHVDTGAGLDVSPAVRGYLHLGDISHTEWNFVPSQDVPPGPWRNIITSSAGNSIN